MSKPGLMAVILAAGQGTRMKSALPKVLHQVAGKAMVDYVIDAARAAGCTRIVVIAGHGLEHMQAHFAATDVTLVEQNPQLGSGHAVQQALPQLREAGGDVLILNGDAPLLEPASLHVLASEHRDGHMEVTFLSATVVDAQKLGRVVRCEGRVQIVEWADATEEERRINEVNAGIYCFDAHWLAQHLPRLTLSKKGEYYLTELVEMADKVRIVPSSSLAGCVGVDTREALAEAERLMQERLRAHWMEHGVTFVDPPSAFLDAATKLARDVTICPNTIVQGSEVSEGSVIGPGSRLENSRVGARCRIRESVLESATIEDDVEIGPFSHLRPDTYVERGARLGNYVEIKNARVGRNTQIHHFSYTGDAEVGQRVNIGAGTITCNYDSETEVKSRTIIGDGASTGSDTLLVAPVTLGAGAMTGSGAVVTHDVPPNTLALGVPAREIRKVRKNARARSR